MKNKMYKLGALMLCLVMTAALFAGCGEKTAASEEQAVTEPAVTINHTPLSNELTAYTGFAYALQAVAADEAFFDNQDNVKQVKQMVLDQLKQYWMPIAMAEKLNISLDEESEQAVDKIISDMEKEAGGAEKLKELLEENHMSLELQKEMLRQQMLQSQLLEDYYGKKITADSVLRAKHILIKFDALPQDKDGNPSMTEEEWREDRLKLAKELSERAQNGEDFDSLINQYNEDPGMAANPDGYYFVEGQMQPAFYEAANALSIDGISEPVEVNDYYKGFHIIQRLAPEESVIEEKRMEMAASGPEAQKDAGEALEAMQITTNDEAFDAIFRQEIENAKVYMEEIKASYQAESAAASASESAEADSTAESAA